MFVANQSIDFRLSASYWSKALSHLLDCSSTRTPRHQYFVAFPSSEISSTTKQKLYWNRLTLLNKGLQFLLVEGLEVFFCGNSTKTSDCPVCSMLKTLSGCSMLAEIVRNSFTGRGDLSELCSQICRVAIFNPCQELYLLGGRGANWASIKSGTWNIPEHPGTWNNYHNYEKNM